MGAIMLGVEDQQINGPAIEYVTQVVQGASRGAASSGTFATAWAGTAGIVTAASRHLGPGKVILAVDAFSDIRDILSWTDHGSPPDANAVRRSN